MRPDLPCGTVTFVFTDVEGSTSLLNDLGAERYAEALVAHRAVIREACTERGGVEVDTQGDALFFAFPTAPGALAAAERFTDKLASNGDIRVRVGIHTGTPLVGEEGYVGNDVHRAARIASSGHGGQVLVSASTAALVEIELTDLGEHRFKDIAAAERVFQLGSGEFPGLKSLYRTNLPAPATPFLGRERELQDIVELLTATGARLVTLTGPGGSGKTRLMLQAASEASDGFPEGVYWIPLAPLHDESALATTVAQALTVHERPGVEVLDSVIAALAGKRVLLVVDNCEHLVAGVAEFIRQLVGACLTLVVLASSRERLGIRAEHVYGVPPMSRADGLALFIERATRIRAGFEPDEHVDAICELVDELPLAIELAAAHVRSLSTETIREHLVESRGLLATRDRDVEARQRTLEATIAWSYDLLDLEEQQALRGLSVFADGCTLAAAEAVAGADLESLESLLDKSLIRHRVDESGSDRYWLLETIREFAARRLSAAGEAGQVFARHTGFFLAYAPELQSRPGRTASTELVDRYRADAANFRLASTRALTDGDVASALRFVRYLGRLLYRLGPFAEGYSIACASLALPGGADDDRAYSLVRAATFALHIEGEIDSAHVQLSDAEALFRKLNDRAGLVEVFACRCKLGQFVGDYDEASASAEKQAAIARELDDPYLARWADLNLADTLCARAIEEEDRRAAEQSRVLYEAARRGLGADESEFEAVARNNARSFVEFAVGNHSECIVYARRSLVGLLNLGLERTPDPLLILGWATAAQGMTPAGVRLVSAAMRQYGEEGMHIERWGRVQMKRFEHTSRQALGDVDYEEKVREGKAMSNEAARELALGVKNLGE